jgi:Polyketide cyclase / dehydrase and lipid transport
MAVWSGFWCWAAAADTAVLLNLSPPAVCVAGVAAGARRWDSWSWLLTCRWRHLPKAACRAIVRNYAVSMVEVTVEETVSCTAHAFLELVMDPRRYAEVDRKLGRIDWVQRDGDVTEFRFRSALPGLGPGPKIVSRMTLTPGKCVEVRLPDRPENRLARRFSTFEASFACVPADGGIRVIRRIAFGFAAPLRWLAEPVLRRKLRADVEAEVRGAKRLLER